MKRLLLSIALTLGIMGAWGQEIMTQQVVADDYIKLFEEMGYKVYSFDISEFEDVRSYQPIIKHYKQGDKEGEYILGGSGFGWAVSGEHKSNVKVTFSPEENGKKVGVYFDDNSGLSLPITFEGQTSPDGEVNYSCESRPFKLEGKMIDGFYPLVLLGSYWYDAGSKVFRFCGSTEITSELKEDIMKRIPEYYIIGVKIEK